MSEKVTVAALPKCNFCDLRARYDFATRMGMWAYACSGHYHAYRLHPTLGTGKGQKLILASEPDATTR